MAISDITVLYNSIFPILKMQGYVQRLKYEKEQLEQQLRHLRAERGDRSEKDTKYRQLMEELNRLRRSVVLSVYVIIR